MREKSKNKYPEPRINDEITGYETVRVVYEDDDKQKSEVMTLKDALILADKLEKDLIEINSTSSPAIVKIDIYEKWLYNEKKKLKNKKQKTLELKEIQLSPNIGTHDLDVKIKQAKSFINEGHKVKVTLTLKGREKLRREECKKCLFEFLVKISDIAIPENMPKDDENKTICILKRKSK